MICGKRTSRIGRSFIPSSLKEVADLYIDSLNRTLDDVGKPAAFVAAYALLGRIRMISTEAVLKAAERVIQDIIESYNRPPISIQELKKLTDERPADPWHEFYGGMSSRTGSVCLLGPRALEFFRFRSVRSVGQKSLYPFAILLRQLSAERRGEVLERARRWLEAIAEHVSRAIKAVCSDS